MYVYLRTLVERLSIPFMTCLGFSDFQHSHYNGPHIFTLGETRNHLEPTLNSNNTNNVGFYGPLHKLSYIQYFTLMLEKIFKRYKRIEKEGN